jgi:hypothetical protein
MLQIIGKDGIFNAAAKGDTSTVLALVNDWTQPNTRNENWQTPLFLAAKNGHTQTVRTLVQACGAEVTASDNNGCTPVWVDAQHGHTEPVRVLVEDCGGNVHTADTFGCIPVWIVAEGGHTETVRELVRVLWANDSIADNYGQTQSGQLP